MAVDLSNKQEHVLIQIESVLPNPAVPKLYANGFTVGLSAMDVHVIMQINAFPVGVVNMSLASAKSLYDALGQLIILYQERTGTIIESSAEIQKKLLSKNENT